MVLLLKEARLKQGLSATQLAAKIGISRAAITHLEADRARPSLWILIKIANGLGFRLNGLIKAAEKFHDSQG